MNILIGLYSILGTVIIYYCMKKVYAKFYTPIMLPIVTVTTIIVCFLIFTKIPYEQYMIGGQRIVDLLGPAVVALALPLYKQWAILKKYAFPLFIGIFVGTTFGIVSGIILSKLLSIDLLTLNSIIPKSVTSPVAMDIAKVIGGSPTLAAVFVMIAGITGAVFGPYLIKWFNFHHFLSRGIGFGTASHGIGTAKALELGEKEGAISSIAMTLSAVLASILSPLFVKIFL